MNPAQHAATPGCDPRFAELIKARLHQAETQRAELRTAIEAMRAARRLTTSDDEHDPEGSTVSLDQVRDTALLERATQSRDELIAARERLVAGCFGVCERCGRPIPTERLLARPEARLCVPCS